MLPPKLDDSIQPATGSRRQKSRGQALVEFAVLLPTLVLILALAADFGRALTAYIAISGAAREGAAYGMQSTAQAANTALIQQAARDEIGSGGTIWGEDISVVPSVATDAQGYQQVVVTVEYAFSPLIPIPTLPSTVSMERTVRMRVLN